MFSALLGKSVRVTRLLFEHSPGRSHPRHTGDRSAFDVYVEYESSTWRGFVGIEVKYHESLKDEPGEHRARYDEIAAAMGVFRADVAERLRRRPLQQVWRDHLLAGSLLLDRATGFDEGAFAFLYPRENVACAAAVEAYRACLVDDTTSFQPWLMEDVVAAVKATGANWIDPFADRYLPSQ